MTAYRGTKYHGFQRQANAVTVQEVLEKAVSKVLNEPVTIVGCSRTDTGVHANNFCFNVKTESNIRTLGFCRGVNGELPDDISILSCEDVRARNTSTGCIAANQKTRSPQTSPTITAVRSTSKGRGRLLHTSSELTILRRFVLTVQTYPQPCVQFIPLI